MTPVDEIAVRMGELAVSSAPGEVLLSIGLGSCIGLALVDQRRGIAGLAHVMLPEAIGGGGGPAGKFADRAVPELVARTTALGTSRTALRAVLVGGAQMFTLGGGGAGSALDIGVRNEFAVRSALSAARIPVAASATGGDRGRTIRVFPGGAVLSKEAGGAEIELMPGVRA
jgi:chemotaxis protein CheD